MSLEGEREREGEGEGEGEGECKAKLALFSIPAMHCGERSGMVTPPLHSSVAAVPFGWEQVPGKARPCVTFSNNSNATTHLLPIPPRLLIPYGYASDSGAMVLSGIKDDYAWFSSWRKKAFKLKNMKRSATVWTSICEGLKQVVPWKSKKVKKDWSGHKL